MPTAGGDLAHLHGERVAASLYYITVTDPWYKEPGGNWEAPDLGNQGMAMGGVLAGITGFGGGLRRTVAGGGGRPPPGRVVVRMDRDRWLATGRNVISVRKGICTDCAAAASLRMNEEANENDFECKIEIISTGMHAFVIVNREGPLAEPQNWGDDAFIIDVWLQNQYPQNQVLGCAWMNDRSQGIADYVHLNAARLVVDAVIRETLGPLI